MCPSALGSSNSSVASPPSSPVRRQTSYIADSSRGSKRRISNGAGIMATVVLIARARVANAARVVHRQQALQLGDQAASIDSLPVIGARIVLARCRPALEPVQIFAQQDDFFLQLPDMPVKRVEQFAIFQRGHLLE